MAIVSLPAATVVFTLKDETGSTGKLEMSVHQDALAAVVLTGAAVQKALVQAITGCSITGWSLTYSQRETEPAAPAADSRVEHKGVFQFLTEAGKTVTYTVPGILPSLVGPDGNIDEDQLSVAAFVTAITADDAVWSDSNGVNISVLKASYEMFRKTTKRQAPAKRQPD